MMRLVSPPMLARFLTMSPCLSGLAILFLHGRDVAPFCRKASLVAEGFDRVEGGFVSGLGAAGVFLAGVHMVPVLVNDVTTASAHSLLLP